MVWNSSFIWWSRIWSSNSHPKLLHSKVITVKLGDKERFDQEQIGVKELFMDYQPFYAINLLLDKELLPI